MTTFERNGQTYVGAKELEAQAGVAVKPLAGRKAVVACREDRCVMVEDYLLEKGQILVSLKVLSRALGAEVRNAGPAGGVQLVFAAGAAVESQGTRAVQVGQLAPDLRLSTLDGGVISLASLRGQRVLINSWASW